MHGDKKLEIRNRRHWQPALGECTHDPNIRVKMCIQVLLSNIQNNEDDGNK
jgi:hypothetical protein